MVEAAASEPVLTVLVPMFNEAEVFAELSCRLKLVLDALSVSSEVLLVDDGSSDDTARLIREWSGGDRRVRGLVLSRNFGHQMALSAGLERSRGAVVIVLDADLQDPPELIPELLVRWKQGFEVVYGIRRDRKEPWLKRIAYGTFYRLLRRLSQTPVPLDAGDFCLMDRKVVDWIVRMPERTRFLRGLRSFVGFRQVGLPYDRPARAAGQTKYTLRKLCALALDGVLSFSPFPLRIASVLGLLMAALSCCAFTFYLAWWCSGGEILGKRPQDVGGFMTLVMLTLMFSGVQMFFLGVIGEYVGRIYQEVKRRPGWIVAEEIPATEEDRSAAVRAR